MPNTSSKPSRNTTKYQKTGKVHCIVVSPLNVIRKKGYIEKMLHRFKHEAPSKPLHSPYLAAPKLYGNEAQKAIPKDTSPTLPRKASQEFNKLLEASYIMVEQLI
ncbi:hypothetical protein ACHAXS_001302 [Conticribra weissflogii]